MDSQREREVREGGREMDKDLNQQQPQHSTRNIISFSESLKHAHIYMCARARARGQLVSVAAIVFVAFEIAIIQEKTGR